MKKHVYRLMLFTVALVFFITGCGSAESVGKEDKVMEEPKASAAVGSQSNVATNFDAISATNPEAAPNYLSATKPAESNSKTIVVEPSKSKAIVAQVTQVDEPSAEPEKKAEELDVTIGVMNNLSVDIGAFAYIDPLSGKQVNLPGVKSGDSTLKDIKLMSDTKELKWAVYNTAGQLYKEGSTDITGIKKGVVIRFEGVNDIDKIEKDIY